jgi:LmbE family N-acetylglucosaminyl deacetylase
MTRTGAASRRQRFCAFAIARHRTHAEILSGADLARPAVVFAPHPDDEALACGGTILLKKRAGAPVHLVFMTDGSRSHPALIEPRELREMRRAEALEAAARLGIAPGEVTLLDFEDSRLAAHRAAAVERVGAILRSVPVEQVFVPHPRDGNPDHRATCRIVRAALAAGARPVAVYEYTVYLWSLWPWADPPAEGGAVRRLVGVLRGASWTLRFLLTFRHCVPLAPVLEGKRAAVAAHRSQMTPLAAGWTTLADWRHGEFLPWFFRDCEFFRRRR